MLRLLPIPLALLPLACAGPAGPPAQVPATIPEAPEAPAEELPPPAPVPLDAALFERVVIVGASMSAGFNLQLETGVDTRLADALGEALLVEHNLVHDGATSMLFLDTEPMAAEMIAAARAAEPTLVLAVDFPFWFLYGPARSVEDRLARLDRGLELLASLDAPVLVGDVPFMEGAAGGMIPHASMPPAEAFTPANGRIAAWADEDEDRVLVGLSAFNRTLRDGGAFEVAGHTWDPAMDGPLLQADELHPNLAGTAVLVVQTLARLAEERGELLDGVVLTDPLDLADAVDDRMAER